MHGRGGAGRHVCDSGRGRHVHGGGWGAGMIMCMREEWGRQACAKIKAHLPAPSSLLLMPACPPLLACIC